MTLSWYDLSRNPHWDTPGFCTSVNNSRNLHPGHRHMPENVKDHCAAANNLSSGWPNPQRMSIVLFFSIYTNAAETHGNMLLLWGLVSCFVPVYGHFRPKVITNCTMGVLAMVAFAWSGECFISKSPIFGEENKCFKKQVIKVILMIYERNKKKKDCHKKCRL